MLALPSDFAAKKQTSPGGKFTNHCPPLFHPLICTYLFTAYNYDAFPAHLTRGFLTVQSTRRSVLLALLTWIILDKFDRVKNASPSVLWWWEVIKAIRKRLTTDCDPSISLNLYRNIISEQAIALISSTTCGQDASLRIKSKKDVSLWLTRYYSPSQYTICTKNQILNQIYYTRFRRWLNLNEYLWFQLYE